MPNKSVKKAEIAVTDANVFPLETCREKLARRYGVDAVALSGPCEGKPLADAICEQLKSRWDQVEERFAKDESKVLRLAMKMAESWGKDEDDTVECTKDLEAARYSKEAASGIANYLKAYHVEKSARGEIEYMMEEIMNNDKEDDELNRLGDDNGEIDEVGDLLKDDDNGDIDIPLPGDDLATEETITIEIPVEVAKELVDQIEGYEHGQEGDEIIDLDLGNEGGLDLGNGDEIVPGEPEEKPNGLGEEQFVEGEESACVGCEGREDKGMALSDTGPEETECALCGASGRSDDAVQPKDDNLPPGISSVPHGKPNQFGSNEEDLMKEAAMELRAGKLRRVGQKTLKIGPEMSINNTDQQAGGHNLGKAKDKDVEDPKALDESNIKTDPEKAGRGGHMAGGDKVQDGATMGHEPKFDPHKVTEDEVTGGQSSLQGPDESFPEGGPDVPAGSSPIGNEEWEGGNVSTKGTVIATLTPQGVVLAVDGNPKRVRANVSITQEHDLDAIVEAIGALDFNGDVEKFAKAAIEIVKAKNKKKDGITHTDTSELEGSNFTNDCKKSPQEGGASVYYDKKAGSAPKDDEGVTKIDTSKLEGTKFTNDSEKEAETDDKAKSRSMGSSEKEVKTAADSDVGDNKEKVVNHHPASGDIEKPKALDDGNIHVDPEIKGRGGHMAGGTEVSAGDGSAQGYEKKFEAHEITEGEVTGGQSSIQGQDESFPDGPPEVPCSSENIQNEDFEGGDVSTKGTVIAEADDQSQKREASDLDKARNEATIREARLKAASVLVADMLASGEIKPEEYAETLERFASFEIPAIQALAISIRKTREKIEARAKKSAEVRQTKVAGLGVPVVYDSEMEEKPLAQKLSELFSSNKLYDPEMWDDKGRRRLP